MLNLNTPVKNIPRISEKYAQKLQKIGIFTAKDLLFHIPFRYEDYSNIIPISKIRQGEICTVIGKITAEKTIRTWKRKMYVTEILIQDEAGSARAVWFNQPYLSESFQKGKELRISGKVSSGSDGLYFGNPAWEFSQREPTNTGRLVPIYPETEGITSRWLRWQIQSVLKNNLDFPDPLPNLVLKKLHLPNLKKAMNYIHFPQKKEEFEIARKRFAFEEMLTIQLKSLIVRSKWQGEKSVVIDFKKESVKEFVDSLPFKLTDAQRKSAFEIIKDLEKERPMNRLLNGDVGSGKTIVAAIASLNVIKSGRQVAIMAPTEILARQHYKNFCGLFKDYDFKISLITGSIKAMNYITNYEKKTKIHNSKFIIQNSSIVIGTHALIQKDVKFHKLAFIVIDEQHRFGVAQRAYLQQKASEINDGIKNIIPHFLTMSATPIPRTLAMALFGNLDLSILDEMPKNRKKIITKIITPQERAGMYEFVRQEIKKGRQAFVILPLVEESKILTEVKAATKEHERLSEEIFPDLKLGLVHGRLKAKEKEEVMEKFQNNECNILVATAVVEVGIDIPNATVMIIEDADRFGLSQLHQFRGRIGRGEHQSYCFLLTGKNSGTSKKRLDALVKSGDGFKIAEADLALRGPGEFFGTRQSGIPDISMENLANVKLIQIAREEAQNILKEDPQMKKHPLLKDALKRFDEKVHLE